MSKPFTCDWCGCEFPAGEDRVKLPWHEGEDFGTKYAATYCIECFVRVYDRRCLRALMTDDWRASKGMPLGIGECLQTIFKAVLEERDDEA